MLYNTEPTEFNIIQPLNYKNPLPAWGVLILEFIAPRILLGVDTVTKTCFSSGNRTGRKKLIQLALAGYLKRYEISTSERHFIAYSLGLEGMRSTRVIAPEVDIIKAQELIIANEFCHKYVITNFILWPTKSLLVGQIELNGNKYSLWCPRRTEKPKRIKSLQNELPLSSEGLIVIAPNLRYIYTIAEHMTGLYVPVFFCIDSILDRFMRLDNGVLVPV
ncbi:hypothetical protein [Bacteroides sp.]|uniref:hypothetical protein n=1 Tax=Bacteroides sp. TaxID=29523 RepID=UPI002614702F|nr:hypothetical protein [Bacteroides sp.]MDD3040407.1 hypothetical protein [Bacteroides sp.]